MQRLGAWVRTARDACGSAFDGLVFAVNPKAGAERIAMRKIVRASETRMSSRDDEPERGGASDKGSRLDGPQRWLGSRLSPDSELEAELETFRLRSEELYLRTTAGGAIDTKVDHTVGKGFMYRPKIVAGPGISEEAAKGFNAQLLQVMKIWSKNCDLTGRKSLWALSRIAQRSFEYSGESFTIMTARRRPGRPIPLVLEVVNSDRVSTPPAKEGDPYCRLGIQYHEESGEITGYWVRTTHPFDTKQLEFKWDFIPSNRMLHVYEELVPGQSRGYPWMRRALSRLRDAEDLDEAGIIAAQVEACQAAFVKSQTPPHIAAQRAATGTLSNGLRLEDMRPGKINYLDSTEDVQFMLPTKSNIVGTLHEWTHRRIAAGMDWAYEFLMKDWRGVSFAGGRLVLNGVKIKCGVDQMRLDECWFTPISDQVAYEAVLFQAVEISLSAYSQRPWVYQASRWTPPAWRYPLNPREEIEANALAVETNQRTLDEVLADNGDELDETLDQRERERRMEEKRDIVPADRIAAQAQMGQANAAANNGGAAGGKSKSSKPATTAATEDQSVN